MAIVILLLDMQALHSQSRCDVEVKITPAKTVYLKDEPIRLRLTYMNRGSTESQVLVENPSFYEDLQFNDLNDGLAKREIGSREGIGRMQSLGPGQKWSTPIFLQTYLENPPVGTYTIQFQITVYCKGGKSPLSKGTFSFQVLPSTSQQLRDVITVYDKALNTPESRTAVEALTSMDTPLVIPELEKIIAIGDTQEGFRALAKFETSPEARKGILDFLSSKDPHYQAAALDVMSEWRQPLDQSQLTELEQSPDRSVKLAIIRYLDAAGQSEYRSVIEKFVNDHDQYVAQQARRVVKSLANKSYRP
ncbi:MAG TPA: hypothetical protein VFW25_07120 [Silvibacterium sp.]|nr:hypothetical protein [Silvibacterium sp.]